MLLRDQIAQEASALYGFVESISSACTPPPRSVAFTDASERLFQYIAALSTKTKQYLKDYPVELEGSEEQFIESRRELSTIRIAWREIHQFIKPAVHADTLNQPTALIAAMLQRLKQLPGFEASDFAIFHTDTFDYLQVNPVFVNQAAAGLAAIVGAEGISKPILIGIPSSQGTKLFLNCLVAHEMGHYVFGQRHLRPLLIAEIESALRQTLGNKYAGQGLQDRSFHFGLLAKWAEELFCDLFATYLIGPSYSFAYVELFDVAKVSARQALHWPQLWILSIICILRTHSA